MDEIDIIEVIRQRCVPEEQIDAAKIMMGVDPFVTRRLSTQEHRIMAIIGY